MWNWDVALVAAHELYLKNGLDTSHDAAVQYLNLAKSLTRKGLAFSVRSFGFPRIREPGAAVGKAV